MQRSAEGSAVKFKRKVLVIAFLVGLFSVTTAQASAPTMNQFKMEPKAFAKQIVGDHVQFNCLVQLWTWESHWNHLAKNKVPVYQVRNGKRVALHAFGIAQLLGETSRLPYIQIQKGLRYIESRYSTPCRAMKWHLRHNWY
jgi:hypothetical protein